jgi:RecA-family ATPase
VNPRLVIIDVLMMFRPAGNRSDNSYEADYNAIKGLQALAGQFNVAIVVVHHTRKSGSDVDPFEKVSGTLGLSGAADAALILDRDGNGATLYGRGRDVEEVEVAVSFDKATCRWNILGAASEVRRTRLR